MGYDHTKGLDRQDIVASGEILYWTLLPEKNR